MPGKSTNTKQDTENGALARGKYGVERGFVLFSK